MKTILETQQTDFDYTTGEIKTDKKIKTIVHEQEPSYMKVYLQDIAYLYDIKGADPILLELLKLMTYEGIIILNSAIKRRIAATVDMKIGTINNVISELSKKLILVRRDRGIYEANPYIFGKGKWIDIKARRNNIEYSVTIDKEGNRHVSFGLGTEYKIEKSADDFELTVQRDGVAA
jgi:hypothetical protein